MAKENKAKVQEEKPVEDINTLLPGATPINKPNKETPAYEDTIENARVKFASSFKKGRYKSYIAMGIVLAAAIGAVICLGMNEQYWKIIGWSIVGAVVVGMIIYYIINRNSMPGKTKDYIKLVNEQLNMRNFADTRISDAMVDEKDKMDLSDPISDAVYASLNNIASRNVVTGKFLGRSFKVADLGLYSGEGKKRSAAFVGKYLSYPNELHFEHRYIIVSKGAQGIDKPTDIEDLVPLVDEGNFVIYGQKDAVPATDLSQKFIDAIKKIKVYDHLLNLNVVIWAGHSAVYASFDDSVMTLPFQKEFDKSSNEQYASTLIQLLEALSLIC